MALGGLVAYRMGMDFLSTEIEIIDNGTPNDDYSNDIIARAQYLVRNYGWKCPGKN